MKIKKSHVYQVIYKGKEVINYEAKNPLNKDGWVLSDTPRGFSPLPDSILEQLLNDSDVTIIDMGAL